MCHVDLQSSATLVTEHKGKSTHLFDGPSAKVGNAYMRRIVLINVINFCWIPFELLPSHQWKYSTVTQNLKTWFQIWSAEAVGRIFLFKWNYKIYSCNCWKKVIENKIVKLKSPRTLSNTLPSISHKTSMKTNHAVIKTVYSGSNKCWDTVRQTCDNDFVGPHAL